MSRFSNNRDFFGIFDILIPRFWTFSGASTVGDFSPRRRPVGESASWGKCQLGPFLNWHFPEMALLAIFCAIENLSSPNAGTAPDPGFPGDPGDSAFFIQVGILPHNSGFRGSRVSGIFSPARGFFRCLNFNSWESGLFVIWSFIPWIGLLN